MVKHQPTKAFEPKASFFWTLFGAGQVPCNSGSSKFVGVQSLHGEHCWWVRLQGGDTHIPTSGVTPILSLVGGLEHFLFFHIYILYYIYIGNNNPN